MSGNIDIQELIAKFLAGEASPEEAIQLEDWKAASVNNKIYFDSAAKIFVSTDINETAIKQQAWINIKAGIIQAKKSGKVVAFRWWKLAIAASVIVLIGISVLFKHSNIKRPKATKALVYKTDSSSKKIQLEDGSDIELAINSSITLDNDFGKTNRNISLTGSAFFFVKHDSSLPFIINMNQLHIKDVGTKFYVHSKADTLLVTMEEGEVLLYDDFGATQKLINKDKAAYIKSAREFKIYLDSISQKDTILPKNLPANKVSSKKNKGNRIKPPATKPDSTNVEDEQGPIKTDN